MIFTPLSLLGSYIVDIKPLTDDRGFFARSFCMNEFIDHKLRTNVDQCNISFNAKRGALRGMHFQTPPKAEAKLVRCIRGRIHDVIIDLGQESPTYCRWEAVEMSGSDHRTPYREEDAPGPLQIYGITRAAGEFTALSEALGQTIVIRTCGLYGLSGARSKGGYFVDKRIDDAKKRMVLEMGSDQIVFPTYTGDLSHAVFRLIEHPSRMPGIYHLANEGECSWLEFAKTIYEILGLKVDRRPVDRQGRSGDMRRPLYSVMANTKAKALGITLPHWREGLSRFLRERQCGLRCNPR